MAIVTNYHKLSGLKQHKWITSQFYKLEVQHGSHWTKIKVEAELSSILEVLEEDPLPDSTGYPHFLACGYFLHCQSQQHQHSTCLRPCLCLPLSFPNSPIQLGSYVYKDHCDYSEPTWIIRDIKYLLTY